MRLQAASPFLFLFSLRLLVRARPSSPLPSFSLIHSLAHSLTCAVSSSSFNVRPTCANALGFASSSAIIMPLAQKLIRRCSCLQRNCVTDDGDLLSGRSTATKSLFHALPPLSSLLGNMSINIANEMTSYTRGCLAIKSVTVHSGRYVSSTLINMLFLREKISKAAISSI